MESCQVRTDLALEASEGVPGEQTKVSGVRVNEYKKQGDILVTKVCIETKNAAKMLGKPMGCYVTIEAPTMAEPDEGYHREVSKCLKKELCKLLPEKSGKKQSYLIVGLGNRAVTADALGPFVIDNLYINRHLIKEYGKAVLEGGDCNQVSSIEPGVMAKTGMETAEIIKGIIRETKPDCVIAIDALAARSIKRLSRTIQICNTGIWPGSGVGNHRNALTEETLGVPVIAIGVPMVVDAATIVGDALDKLLSENKELETLRYGGHRQKFAELNNMYMTGKDVDDIVKRVSYTVSEGLNMALQG
ncbi:MAG: GPR endopeptidase [Lachnospiraceae bacterium]|nr:GPR endopeptidase [Lachnospiraceae bacterium]